MANPLESVPTLEAASQMASTLLSAPGKTVWMAIDGSTINPFLSTTNIQTLERRLLDDYRFELFILTANDHGLLRANPTLRPLADHLPSRVKVRTLDPKAETFTGDWYIRSEWLLTDAGGVLYRNSIGSTEWYGSERAGSEVRRLQMQHEELWNHAQPSSELRSMHI